MPISRASINTCVEKGYWLFDARRFEVSASADGRTFAPLAAEDYPALTEQSPNQINTHTLQFATTAARYVKVKVVSEHTIPAWHPGHGNPGFVFVDEIAVF